MKRRKKIWLAFSIILVFLGILLISGSTIYTTRQVESVSENGISYEISKGEQEIKNGTKIIRNFKTGEKMTVRFTHSLKPPYYDFYIINFTIISPNNEATVFWYELEPYFNRYSGETQLVITNLTITKTSKDIDTSQTSKATFIGETCTDGNYTLVYISPYPFQVLSYVAFVKIIDVKEYPYANAFLIGTTILCTGTILALWTVIKGKTKTYKRFKFRQTQQLLRVSKTRFNCHCFVLIIKQFNAFSSRGFFYTKLFKIDEVVNFLVRKCHK